MEMAPINKIIDFSNVDGPGNRCSIFFQGCPFRCLYCHNPETINICSNCGDCVLVCPKKALTIVDGKVKWDRNKCINCDSCIHVCKHLSSPKISMMSVDEVMEHIKKIRPFIRGITVSGGECTNYPKFLLELFKKCKKIGLTCLIDSNGCYDYHKDEELILLSDGVMLDVKAFKDDFHRYLTGSDNEIVLNNLKYLLSINKLEEVRTVILPNKDKENIVTVENVSRIILGKTKYKLLRYRYFGVRSEGLDVFKKVIVDLKTVEKYRDIAIKNGASNVVII